MPGWWNWYTQLTSALIWAFKRKLLKWIPSNSVKSLDIIIRDNAEPSLSYDLGRCREQTAGTYGWKAMVKACSRPRTFCVYYKMAMKIEVVRKSAAERHAGSIPAPGTNQRVLIIVILVLYYMRSLALI